MKKIFILTLITLFTTTIFAQSDSTESKITHYVSLGLSTSNSIDFKTTSYIAVETGVNYENLGLGMIFGRGNLAGFGKGDVINNYFYEIKTIGNFPLGKLSGNIILGYGGYFKTFHMFVEYGYGMGYSKGNFGYGITISNWDGIVYLTPSITYNF